METSSNLSQALPYQSNFLTECTANHKNKDQKDLCPNLRLEPEDQLENYIFDKNIALSSS